MKIAICGTGPAARYHIKEIKRHPSFEIACVYSKDLNRAKQIGQKFNIPHSNNLDDALADEKIECVDISTINKDHYSYSLKALKANKHVIVEKPAVFKLRQLEELNDLSKEKNKVMLIDFQKKLCEAYRKIVEEYNKRKYGSPIYATSNIILPRRKDYFDERKSSKEISGGGVLMYSAIHELDMMINLFGKVNKIYGYGVNISHDLSVEDTANLTLVFQNGVIYNLFATYADTPKSLLYQNKNFFIENEIIFEKEHILFSEFYLQYSNKPKERCIRLPKIGSISLTYSPNRSIRLKRGTYYDVLTELYKSVNNPDYESVLSASNSYETHRVIEYFYNNCV